jgi:hypothetical protein
LILNIPIAWVAASSGLCPALMSARSISSKSGICGGDGDEEEEEEEDDDDDSLEADMERRSAAAKVKNERRKH